MGLLCIKAFAADRASSSWIERLQSVPEHVAQRSVNSRASRMEVHNEYIFRSGECPGEFFHLTLPADLSLTFRCVIFVTHVRKFHTGRRQLQTHLVHCARNDL